jgi:glutamine phosphoribosylpyrophosphate amidotransferase
MCGVIGLVNKNFSKSFPTELLRSMANEAQIRGQHATGAAVIHDNGYIAHNILSVPASVFPVEEIAYGYNTRAAIVHCRYSTSDLSYNQPMIAMDRDNFQAEIALIHNGVVSQADPSAWKETYGVDCYGRNDSEILLRLFERGDHPLHVVPSSQACIAINAIEHEFCFWRNEQRPLYYAITDDYIAVASTRDILLRSGAGTDDNIFDCEPCVDYSVILKESDNPLRLHTTGVRIPTDDLQRGIL